MSKDWLEEAHELMCEQIEQDEAALINQIKQNGSISMGTAFDSAYEDELTSFCMPRRDNRNSDLNSVMEIKRLLDSDN